MASRSGMSIEIKEKKRKEYIKEALSNTVAERKIPDVEATNVPSPRTGAMGAGMASWAPHSALN